jgi:DNA-binding NarL/FixJ family response regulator
MGEVKMEAVTGVRNNADRDFRATKIVFVVAHAGTLYQCLVRTVQERLPGCEIHVSEAGAKLPDFDGDPDLFLIEAGCRLDLPGLIDGYRERAPSTPVALLVDKPFDHSDTCDALFAAGLIQGVLPWSLRLEVWLAAVSLLLSGGEYFISANRRPGAPIAAIDAPVAEPHAHAHGDQQVAAARFLASLTTRETQILELLSEGHQNKLIAHKMSLSEHTVKVHVHNLLTKLRVTNRTQAAATYRRGVAETLTMPAVLTLPTAFTEGSRRPT